MSKTRTPIDVLLSGHYTERVNGGTELRLFDPKRNPRDWTEIIRATQCAVFLKDRETSRTLALDGKPCRNPDEASCLVFDELNAAQQFCETEVRAHPQVRCEIYDAEGLAHPPLDVIVHWDHREDEESSARSSRRRKLIALILFLFAPPLIWIDMRRANTIIVPTFLAFTCILTGLRFLYWDFGLKHQERERRHRIEAHRRKEAGGA